MTVASSAQPDRLDGALICVVGARRSGTHWVQRLLSSHPQVVAIPGETYLFSRGVVPLLERLQHGSRASPMLGQVFTEPEVVRGDLRQLLADVLVPYLDAGPGGATHVLERTPEHVQHMQTIAGLFPATRFVHVIRDGREVVRSLLQQPWGPTTARDAAGEWRASVEAGRRQGRRLRHYREVVHEELRADPEAHVRELFAWLGLEATDEVVASALVEAQVVANTRPRAARGSLGWRERRQVRRVASDLLRDLGYGRSPRRVRPAAPSGAAEAASGAVSSIHEAQRATDRTMEVLRHVVGPSAVEDLLEEDVELVVSVGGAQHRWRGADRLGELVAAARQVPALRGRQTWATQHASRHQYTVVVRGRVAAEPEGWCVVVVGFGAHGIRTLAVHGCTGGGR